MIHELPTLNSNSAVLIFNFKKLLKLSVDKKKASKINTDYTVTNEVQIEKQIDNVILVELFNTKRRRMAKHL